MIRTWILKGASVSETIEYMAAESVARIALEHGKTGWRRPAGYFADCWEAQQRGDMLVLVSRIHEELPGWVKVVWRPDYAPLRDAGIPEPRRRAFITGMPACNAPC
jgi:hypothetical protein